MDLRSEINMEEEKDKVKQLGCLATDNNEATAGPSPSSSTTEFLTPIKEFGENENIYTNILQAPTRPARVRGFQSYLSDSSDADTDSPYGKKLLPSGPLMTSTPFRNADDIAGDSGFCSRIGLTALPVKNLLSDFISSADADVSSIEEELSEPERPNRSHSDDLLKSNAGEENIQN